MAPSPLPYDPLLLSIAAYVYHYPITSPLAFATARLALLDALGCVMETVTSGQCAAMIGPTVKGCVVKNGFKLPGTPFEIDPSKGAFDLGVLIRYLDHNDGFTGKEWGHPSDNLAAILSLSSYLSLNPTEPARSPTAPPVTLRTILVALIKAYEMQGCLQQCNAFNAVGLDHVILVKVASSAVGSWLLGLSEEQAVDAISHAWIDGAPLRTYRQAPNAGPRKGWAGGDTCMRAVHLALLTRTGQPGIPTALSAERWGFCDAVFGGKGIVLARDFGTWVIQNIFFKLVPAEGHAVSAIEAILIVRGRLLAKGKELVRDVRSINVRTHAGALLIIDKSGHLHNAADRDHCLQYMLAVTLWKGELLEHADYRDHSEWVQDQRVEELRAKMVVREDKQFSDDYLDEEKRSMASALRVQLVDGTEIEEVVVEYPLGHPKNPGTVEAVRLKIEWILGLVYGKEEIDVVLDAVHHRGDLPAREFVDLLWKGEQTETK